MALTQISTKGIKDGTITGTDLATNIDLSDSQKLRLGTGNDLVISQDGSEALIRNTTGDFFIQNNAGDIALAAENHITLKNFDGQTYARFMEDGQCELYHDDSKKLETNSAGITVIGSENGDGEINLQADEGDDNADKWRLSAGTNGAFTLKNFASGSAETNIAAVGNGTVELYHAGSKKFFTYVDGVHIDTGTLRGDDNAKIALGSKTNGDLIIFHDGQDTQINNNTGILKFGSASGGIELNTADGHAGIHIHNDNNVELYFNNSKKFETLDTGVSIVGDVRLGNNAKILTGSSSHSITVQGGATLGGGAIKFTGGNSDGDLKFASGSASTFTTKMILDSSGHLGIGTTSPSAALDVVEAGNQCIRMENTTGVNVRLLFKDFQSKTGEIRMFQGNIGLLPHTQVELYHGSNLRLNTTSAGVTVTGTVTETSDIALKSNIQPLTNTLEKIQQITGYKYNLINSISPSMGVIAQDVEKVFPELVHGSEGNKTLQYSGLIGVLVEAVKDLSAKVAALEAS